MLIIPNFENGEMPIAFLAGVPLALSENVVRNYAKAQADFLSLASLTKQQRSSEVVMGEDQSFEVASR